MLLNKVITENHFSLDTTGMRCPWPIIHTKQKISELDNGEKLLVVTTDPSFYIDCEVFVRQSGNKLLNSWQEQGNIYFLLQRA